MVRVARGVVQMSLVPLLAHKHYRTFIELLISFYREKLYRDNYRYRFIAQPYCGMKQGEAESRGGGTRPMEGVLMRDRSLRNTPVSSPIGAPELLLCLYAVGTAASFVFLSVHFTIKVTFNVHLLLP